VLGENRDEALASGAIVDSFTPYQVHVYEAVGGTPASSVPEPASVGLVAVAVAAWAVRRRPAKAR